MEEPADTTGAASPPDPERVRELLDGMARARGAHRSTWGPIACFDLLESTQKTLSDMESDGVAGGAVVIARTQTVGRGRHGRTWHSPPSKGLYLSALVRPVPALMGPADPAGYSFASAIAVCETVAACGVPGAAIKWPNDVLANGRKLSGILVEGRISGDSLRAAMIGIGLNMTQRDEDFPPEIRSSSISMASLSDAPLPSTTRLCAILLDRLDVWLDTLGRQGVGTILSRWRDLSPSATGRRVTVRGAVEPLEGVTMGIDGSGALIVRADDGMMTVLRHSGELSIREVG